MDNTVFFIYCSVLLMTVAFAELDDLYGRAPELYKVPKRDNKHGQEIASNGEKRALHSAPGMLFSYGERRSPPDGSYDRAPELYKVPKRDNKHGQEIAFNGEKRAPPLAPGMLFSYGERRSPPDGSIPIPQQYKRVGLPVEWIYAELTRQRGAHTLGRRVAALSGKKNAYTGLVGQGPVEVKRRLAAIIRLNKRGADVFVLSGNTKFA